MYQQHFNFTAPPFSIAPNPRYVYLSPQHREALAHLLYGISVGGGFIALTGEVGTGKTTLCRCLLEQLPEDVDIALIFNPRLNARELLATICDELHIPHPGEKTSIKRLIDLLNHHLLETHARGRRTILLIDEAQNLSHDVLEQIRLLTNLETNETKLLQIILVGQPELKTLLARKSLRQLSQRITARYHLLPLSSKETEAYINHRLAVSGVSRGIFSPAALSRIFSRSGGIPRLINLICDRALLGAYTLGKTKVGFSIVGKAAREVLPESTSRPLGLALGGLAGLALLLLAAGWHWRWLPSSSFHFVGLSPIPSPPANYAPLASLSSEGNAVDLSGRSASPCRPTAGTGRVAAKGCRPTDNVYWLNSTTLSPEGEGLNSTISALIPPLAAFSPQGEGVDASALPGDGKSREGGTRKLLNVDDFRKLIADPGLTRGVAFSRLYSLWGVNAPAGEYDECQLARQNGLLCLSSKGDGSLLRSLDHPALLEFTLPDGSNHYAALIGMEREKWVLGLGKTTLAVEPAWMLPYWRGNFTLLWKPPFINTGIIKFGKNNEHVSWIRRQFNEPNPPGQESFFDAKLKERVMAFQQRQGLQVDGDVGPITMILMEKSASHYEGPSLAKTSEQAQ